MSAQRPTSKDSQLDPHGVSEVMKLSQTMQSIFGVSSDSDDDFDDENCHPALNHDDISDDRFTNIMTEKETLENIRLGVDDSASFIQQSAADYLSVVNERDPVIKLYESLVNDHIIVSHIFPSNAKSIIGYSEANIDDSLFYTWISVRSVPDASLLRVVPKAGSDLLVLRILFLNYGSSDSNSLICLSLSDMFIRLIESLDSRKKDLLPFPGCESSLGGYFMEPQILERNGKPFGKAARSKILHSFSTSNKRVSKEIVNSFMNELQRDADEYIQLSVGEYCVADVGWRFIWEKLSSKGHFAAAEDEITALELCESLRFTFTKKFEKKDSVKKFPVRIDFDRTRIKSQYKWLLLEGKEFWRSMQVEILRLRRRQQLAISNPSPPSFGEPKNGKSS